MNPSFFLVRNDRPPPFFGSLSPKPLGRDVSPAQSFFFPLFFLLLRCCVFSLLSETHAELGLTSRSLVELGLLLPFFFARSANAALFSFPIFFLCARQRTRFFFFFSYVSVFFFSSPDRVVLDLPSRGFFPSSDRRWVAASSQFIEAVRASSPP